MKNKQTAREFFVVIEEGDTGNLIAEVPQLKGCYTQAKTLDELMLRVKEVIALALEDEEIKQEFIERKIIGIQKVAI